MSFYFLLCCFLLRTLLCIWWRLLKNYISHRHCFGTDFAGHWKMSLSPNSKWAPSICWWSRCGNRKHPKKQALTRSIGPRYLLPTVVVVVVLDTTTVEVVLVDKCWFFVCCCCCLMEEFLALSDLFASFTRISTVLVGAVCCYCCLLLLLLVLATTPGIGITHTR